MTDRAPGLYWVRFKDESEWIPGSYDGSEYAPWQCVGSDEIFEEERLEVGEPCRREDSQRLAAVVAYCRANFTMTPSGMHLVAIQRIVKGET